MTKRLDSIAGVILGVRYRFASEAELQRGIADVLLDHLIPFEREVVLSSEDRIDFLVEGTIGVEVKVRGGWASAAAQMIRYAESTRIEALLIVTSRWAFVPSVRELSGKPVRCIRARSFFL